MTECPAIIAALPREVGANLVRGWQRHKLADKITVYTNDFAVAGLRRHRARACNTLPYRPL